MASSSQSTWCNFFLAIRRWWRTFACFFMRLTDAPLSLSRKLILDVLAQSLTINAWCTLKLRECISPCGNSQHSKHVFCDLRASTRSLHTLEVNELRQANLEPRVTMGQVCSKCSFPLRTLSRTYCLDGPCFL